MKLAPLLAQYFYQNKRLDLPGIGTFLLDPSVIIEQENSKPGKPGHVEGISFETNTAVKESPELIEFISSQTGKMKTLASSDLESHLELAKQFLNIGNPFLFEGIGSIVKISSGQFAFISGQIMPEKMRDYSDREISSTSSTEESFTGYESVFFHFREKTNWKNPVAVLLLMTGVGLAIWGGYMIYKSTNAKKNVQQETIPVRNSIPLIKNDTITTGKQNISSVNYKFVLEVAAKKRAFERYSKLQSYQWPVQMETKDSLTYILFLLLPVSAADTTRIIDSLTIMNGRKVYIEK